MTHFLDVLHLQKKIKKTSFPLDFLFSDSYTYLERL